MNSANFRENNSRAAYLTRQTTSRFPTSRDVTNHGDREEDFPGRKEEFPSARFRVNHVSGGEKGGGEGEAGSLFFLANSTRIARKRSVVARRTEKRGFLPRYTKATFVFSGRCHRGGVGAPKIAADEVL